MANKEKMVPPTLEMIQGNPYNYTFDEVAKCMGEERAKSLFKTLYKNGVSPKNQTMTIKDIYVGGDTTKYAFELQDGYCIETVCIKRRTGNTVCVSTMVGCPVGCIFCASGKNGFIRNLSPAEIVQQIVLLKERVNRIVFMGMGEPLFNYDNLIKSIHILRDRNGLNFPTDGINVSTVGPVEQLKRLREEHLKNTKLPPINPLTCGICAALIILQVCQHACVDTDVEGITLIRTKRHKACAHAPAVQIAAHIDAGVGHLLGIHVVTE